MCESTVYLKTEEGEEELMQEVARLQVRDGRIVMSNILGEEKAVKGRIESIDFLDHKLVISPH